MKGYSVFETASLHGAAPIPKGYTHKPDTPGSARMVKIDQSAKVDDPKPATAIFKTGPLPENLKIGRWQEQHLIRADRRGARRAAPSAFASPRKGGRTQDQDDAVGLTC